MEDFDSMEDPTLLQVEAICQLVDALKDTTNKDIRKRLLVAMDLVIAKLGPVPSARAGSVIDVTGRN